MNSKRIQNHTIDFFHGCWKSFQKLSSDQKTKLFLFLFVVGGICAALYVSYQSLNLPKIDAVVEYEPRVVTIIYDNDDKVIAEFSTEQRIELKKEEMPDAVKKAFIAAEDDEFYEHHGINPLTLVRAAVKNFMAGSKVQGGSTITQQVAKNFFLSPEKSYSRKIKELFLAREIEKKLSKDQILSRYLNQIYLGQSAYGIESASQVYFGKHAKDLTIAEAAILGGLPKSPSKANPISNPEACKQRQHYVLHRMHELKMISDDDYDSALREAVKVKNHIVEVKWPAPYFSEYVRRYLLEKYGKKTLYEEGLKIYTTINQKAQVAAQEAVDHGLEEIDKRLGLRHPTQNFPSELTRQAFLAESHKKIIGDTYDYKILNPDGTLSSPVDMKALTPLRVKKGYQALVMGRDLKRKLILVQVGNRAGSISPENYLWAHEANPTEIYREKIIREPLKELQVGDLIDVKYLGNDSFQLDQKPLVQGSQLSYRLPDGAIHTMVGGYDFYSTRSEFNRAMQAVRQPGSTFKPFIYGAALEKGLTPASIIVDSPIVYQNKDEKDEIEKTWKPSNYGSVSYGDTTLRNAIAFSRNIPTIKLLQYIKVPTAIDMARRCGIQSKLNEDLTLALGSSGVTLNELLSGISVFANQGKRLTPYYIRRVEDRNGNKLEEHQNLDGQQVVSPQVAFLVTSLMRSVVDYGTGMVVSSLGRPIAGKTGTTSDYKDALFVGFIPQMISGVWVGFDENQQIGPAETGTRAAAPIWLDYMKVATDGMEVKDFAQPEGIVQAMVDTETGNVPTGHSHKVISEYFIDGTAPGQNMRLPSGEMTNIPNKPIIVTGYGQGVNVPSQSTINPADANARSEDSDEDNDNSGDTIRNDF